MPYMLKRRKTADIYIVVAISLFVSILSGCQKKDVRTLQDPSGAHTVTDYSAFSDADVKVQTERETENHVKDLIVKSKISYVEKGQTIDLSDLSVTAEMADGTTKTVKNAKVSVFDMGDKCSVTVLYEGVSGSVSIPVKAPETETETETEAPKKEYVKAYDFSGNHVRDAVVSAGGTDGFSDIVTEDRTGGTRTREIKNGSMTAIVSSFAADTGNGRVELISSGQDAMVKALSGIGIDDDGSGYINLFSGMYDGDKAKYIGLVSVSRFQDGQGVHITCDLGPSSLGPSEWKPAATMLSSMFPEVLTDVDLSAENAFGNIIAGVEYGAVKEDSHNLGPCVYTYDASGNQLLYVQNDNAAYSVDGKTYAISTSLIDGKACLMVKLSSDADISSQEALAKLEHISQMFYHGSFGKDGSGTDHANVTRSEDGKEFILSITG